MNQELLRKLQDEILEAEWNDLRDHHQAGRIVTIVGDLDLVDVAADMVEDDTEVIRSWLGQRKLFRPDADLVRRWEQEPRVRFRFIIVRPYVLIQEIVV